MKLVFSQPAVVATFTLQVGRSKRSVSQQSYCRALCCNGLRTELQRTPLCIQNKVLHKNPWGSYYTNELKKNTKAGPVSFPGNATLGVRLHKETPKGDRPKYRAKKAKTVAQIKKDLAYLTNLLVASFVMLLDPVGKKKNFLAAAPKSLTGLYAYKKAGSWIGRHPACTHFLLGMIRQARLMAFQMDLKELRKVVPEKDLKDAIAAQDRAATAQLLRDGRDWIVRSRDSDNYNFRAMARFVNLVRYLELGYTAEDLFQGEAVDTWGVASTGYIDYHRRGFGDFMRNTGDARVEAGIHQGRKK